MSIVSSQILENPLALFRQFEIIEDPRIERHKRYPLLNILVFTFVAIMSDQQSWYEIRAFCLSNLDWFSQYIDVSSGIPSHDTFRRVFCLLDPQQMEKAIIDWAEEIRAHKNIGKRIIVLDGKSLRGVAWKISPIQLHILNAWDATEDQFIGQMTIDCKTNEITAAPKLLKNLHLEGAIVTVDALMTQKEIASTVVEQKGDYMMALKGNQGSIYEDVQLYFSSIQEGISCARSVEKNRGRVEIRTCTMASADWIESKDLWVGLKNIFKIDSEIYYEGEITKKTRYYMTSVKAGALDFLGLARKHWSIENGLHRSLDMTFKEDSAQEHNRNAAANLSVLTKVALSLLKGVDSRKKLKIKMKECAYSPTFRTKCLLGQF